MILKDLVKEGEQVELHTVHIILYWILVSHSKINTR